MDLRGQVLEKPRIPRKMVWVSKNRETFQFGPSYGGKDRCKKSCKNSISRSVNQGWGAVVQGLGLARTCPGKVQHCPKTCPPYQNENRPLHLRFCGCSHSYTSPHTCWGVRAPVAPPGPPGRPRTRSETKKSMKHRVVVQNS